ncbi:MAG: AzlD domain-containing protein [Anaerolineae bacterium]|jgi:branched-subunit amino acid transport protein|nr:AzlD domain-containing protein [Anaerolineae bacterium]
MENGLTTTLTLIGMMLATAPPRVIPLVMLSQRKLPVFVERWLSYVPVAVLSAMLFPSVLMQEGALALRLDNLYLWASVPAILIAWKTRSLFPPVVAGVVTLAVLRLVIG